jgi:hypothetical protein
MEINQTNAYANIVHDRTFGTRTAVYIPSARCGGQVVTAWCQSVRMWYRVGPVDHAGTHNGSLGLQRRGLFVVFGTAIRGSGMGSLLGNCVTFGSGRRWWCRITGRYVDALMLRQIRFDLLFFNCCPYPGQQWSRAAWPARFPCSAKSRMRVHQFACSLN